MAPKTKKKTDKIDKKAKKEKAPKKEKEKASSEVKMTPSATSNTNPDFEAGVIFNKYDPNHTGYMSADVFRQMWSEAKAVLDENKNSSNDMGQISAFDAGAIFAKFDSDHDGQLNKQDFEAMLRSDPNLFKQLLPALPSASSSHRQSGYLPHEVVSGRLLTHYDETAGIAISRSAIQSHEAMGNRVVPLVEAYNQRYSRLRTYLTSKLLPRRENLLQIRRQLIHSDNDVDTARLNIERETMADVEKIIERLRNIVSMRRSSIQNQILHVDEELHAIENLVKRVEGANDKNQMHSQSGITITSASAMHDNKSTYTPQINWKGLQDNTGAASSLNAFETVNVPRADLMVEIIQQYTDLVSAIEAAATKQITVQVDFPTDDFPKETAERLEVMSRCDKYSHALSVKDHMLWLALQDKEKCEELLTQEKQLSSEYANEVVNWADLCQNLKEELYYSQVDKDKLVAENERLQRILRENGIYVSSK